MIVGHRTLRPQTRAVPLALTLSLTLALAGALTLTGLQAQGKAGRSRPMQDAGTVRFMTLDPGHFHAALVQKDMYPNVSPRVDVYAPLGPDLLGHLGRVA